VYLNVVVTLARGKTLLLLMAHNIHLGFCYLHASICNDFTYYIGNMVTTVYVFYAHVAHLFLFIVPMN